MIVDSGPLSAGFSVSNNGTVVHWPGAFVLSQPTWVSRAGKVLGTVGPPAAYESVALSPDANEVAVDRFDAEPAILRLDMRGAITTVASGNPYQSTPIWRPDGRWLAYSSNESGAINISVAPLAQPGLKRSVSTDGGLFPVWSRDGRELYYVSKGQIIAVPVSAGDSPQLGTPAALFDAKLAGGNLGLVTPYDVATDGRFMVNRFVERTAPPATVMLNWSPSAPK